MSVDGCDVEKDISKNNLCRARVRGEGLLIFELILGRAEAGGTGHEGDVSQGSINFSVSQKSTSSKYFLRLLEIFHVGQNRFFHICGECSNR